MSGTLFCVRGDAMKKVLLGIAFAGLIVATLFKEDHYDAIRHEFYQVWDTIEEMRAGK